jgi:hypothetical protein
VGVLGRHAELLGDERPEPRGVQHASHAEDALAGEARCLQRDVAHRVERVGDDDQDRLRGVLRGLLDDGPDDAGVLRQQVVAAHPRLARQTRRDDDDVGSGRVRVVVRARHPCVVADHRGRLGEVEALALGQSLDDVNQHDVGQPGLGDPLGGRGPDVAGADNGDLVARHVEDRLLSVGWGSAGKPGHCRSRVRHRRSWGPWMDSRRWWPGRPRSDDHGIAAPAFHRHYPQARGDTTMTLTPALALLGIVLVLVAIPFAFSLGPLVIGVLVLIWAARRGSRELSIATPTAQAA